MPDLKTALAGLDWFAQLGLPPDLITAARTELQSKTAAAPGGPATHGPSPRLSADQILAKAADARKLIDAMHAQYSEARNATASTGAITGSLADIGPQMDAARKDVHKAAADAKHAVHTGNLAEAAKLADAATDHAKEAAKIEQKWEHDLDDKLDTKTVVISTQWGDIQHLEEQSRMVNNLAVILMRGADREKMGVVKVNDKLNEIEDATEPMQALLKDPKAAGEQVAAAASAHKDKMLRAATAAELTRQDKKIEDVRATLDTIITDQIETAETQYEAAKKMLEAKAKDDEAGKLLSDLEKHKAQWDILKSTAQHLLKLVATGGEGVLDFVREEGTELFSYFREKRIKERAEDLQAEAGKLRVEGFNEVMAKATGTVQKLEGALEGLRKKLEEDDAEATRHAKTATTEFDANCGDCKFKFKDVETAMKLVQEAQTLVLQRLQNLDGMEQTLEQIKKELKMSRGAPSGEFYESHNSTVLGTIYTYIATHRDDVRPQSNKVDQLMPPLAALFKNAFSSLKI